MQQAAPHARLPDGGRFGHVAADDGWPLRAARWPGRRGTLLLANGRGDFIEKYGEAIRHWTGRGWAVFAFDWRGQGGSGRIGRTPLHGASPGFERWVRDFRGLVTEAAASGPGPLVAAGHSMGGHLLLRALAEGEDRIARALLNAPMLGINSGRIPPALAAALATLGGLLAPHAFGPGQRARLNPAQQAARAAVLTTCPERGAEEYAQLTAHPDLAVGGVTYGWLRDAYASCAALRRPGALEAVATPVRLVLAAQERVVLNAAALEAVARLGAGDYALIPNGEHELWRERDIPRAAAFRAADEHLEQA